MKTTNTSIEPVKLYYEILVFVDASRVKVDTQPNFYGNTAQKMIARFQRVYVILTFMRKEYF